MQASPARPEPRIRKRIPCSITIEGERKKAMVLNLSRGGHFVQTTLRVQRGTDVAVALDLEDHAQPVEVPGRVVWTRRSASRISEMRAGGLGLSLRTTPQVYLDYLDELLPVIKPARTKGPQGTHAEAMPLPRRRFRVRLALAGTTRTRWVEVEADDETAAAQAAGAKLSDGGASGAGSVWAALAIHPIDEKP